MKTVTFLHEHSNHLKLVSTVQPGLLPATAWARQRSDPNAAFPFLGNLSADREFLSWNGKNLAVLDILSGEDKHPTLTNSGYGLMGRRTFLLTLLISVNLPSDFLILLPHFVSE